MLWRSINMNEDAPCISSIQSKSWAFSFPLPQTTVSRSSFGCCNIWYGRSRFIMSTSLTKGESTSGCVTFAWSWRRRNWNLGTFNKTLLYRAVSSLPIDSLAHVLEFLRRTSDDLWFLSRDCFIYIGGRLNSLMPGWCWSCRGGRHKLFIRRKVWAWLKLKSGGILVMRRIVHTSESTGHSPQLVCYSLDVILPVTRQCIFRAGRGTHFWLVDRQVQMTLTRRSRSILVKKT